MVDATADRLAVAEALGLTALPVADDVPTVLKRRWRHGPADHGADVAFQCRGQPAALALALAAVRPQATVIDLAFYQGGADAVRLGEEFHHNGLALRCAQIGRVPRGQGHLWDRARLSAETSTCCGHTAGAVADHLVTDRLPLAEAPALLADLAARRRHVLQAVLRPPDPPGAARPAGSARRGGGRVGCRLGPAAGQAEHAPVERLVPGRHRRRGEPPLGRPRGRPAGPARRPAAGSRRTRPRRRPASRSPRGRPARAAPRAASPPPAPRRTAPPPPRCRPARPSAAGTPPPARVRSSSALAAPPTEPTQRTGPAEVRLHLGPEVAARRGSDGAAAASSSGAGAAGDRPGQHQLAGPSRRATRAARSYPLTGVSRPSPSRCPAGRRRRPGRHRGGQRDRAERLPAQRRVRPGELGIRTRRRRTPARGRRSGSRSPGAWPGPSAASAAPAGPRRRPPRTPPGRPPRGGRAPGRRRRRQPVEHAGHVRVRDPHHRVVRAGDVARTARAGTR